MDCCFTVLQLQFPAQQAEGSLLPAMDQAIANKHYINGYNETYTQCESMSNAEARYIVTPERMEVIC